MNNEIIEVKKDDLRELYQVLTNYPAIAKEQVQNEMYKVFGEDTFKPKDITERIKTFEDACKVLGTSNPLVCQYHAIDDVDSNLSAYIKLRIICAALNEGWEPKFTEDEWRYYPVFWLYTQSEIEEMNEDEKQDRHLISTGDYQTEFAGFAFAISYNAPSSTAADIVSRLCLKNSDLATYCGKQFINLWADFNLIRK